MIGPQSFASVQTVPKVDLNRYVGTWYDIASNPILFQPSCPCERQVLTPEPSHKVSVFNSCNKKTASGPLSTIHGTAQAVDSTDAKLAVDFGLPWKGDYWIIGLDPDYRYAVVSDRFGYSLYILSKTPELDKSLYEAALEAAQKANVSTKRLVFSDQLGCQYPPTDAGLGE
jgi:apolipoprotein D and lipocalin family protein